ncbi:MAG TPA: acyl-CoA dehydrogenase family protein [Dehalococcoidia bacterium]|nr:acyl-CoA dehydrogenase family protein [Dehalococcoidia bacterium]
MTLANSGQIAVSVDAAGRRILTHPEAATITREALVERARAMVPVLRERAPRCEAARQLLPETVEDFERAGFFRICQPKRFGGFEMGLDVLEAVLVEIARGCASSAWTLGILAGHAWWAAQFPEAGQEEIFGLDGVARLPTGIFGRGGRARRVAGGYELSGRWAYQSGCDAANWYGCGALLEAEDGGQPQGITFIVKASDGYIEDDWHVLGMRGTGSKTVVVEHAFVPESRALLLRDVEAAETPGSKVHANPLYSIPLMAFISVEVTGAAVGCALQAAEALDELGRTKPVRARGGGGGETAATHMSLPSFRRRLAESKTLAEAAKTLLLSEAERVMELGRETKAAGRKFTREEIAEITLRQARIIDLSVRAVDEAFAAAGTSATVTGHPIERCLRDVHMMSTHRVLSMDQAAETWGLAHYGL